MITMHRLIFTVDQDGAWFLRVPITSAAPDDVVCIKENGQEAYYSVSADNEWMPLKSKYHAYRIVLEAFKEQLLMRVGQLMKRMDDFTEGIQLAERIDSAYSVRDIIMCVRALEVLEQQVTST